MQRNQHGIQHSTPQVIYTIHNMYVHTLFMYVFMYLCMYACINMYCMYVCIHIIRCVTSLLLCIYIINIHGERERGRIASLCIIYIYIHTHCTYASTIATTNRRGLPGLKHRGISTSSMGSSTWSPELLVTRLVAHHSLAEISWP